LKNLFQISVKEADRNINWSDHIGRTKYKAIIAKVKELGAEPQLSTDEANGSSVLTSD